MKIKSKLSKNNKCKFKFPNFKNNFVLTYYQQLENNKIIKFKRIKNKLQIKLIFKLIYLKNVEKTIQLQQKEDKKDKLLIKVKFQVLVPLHIENKLSSLKVRSCIRVLKRM